MPTTRTVDLTRRKRWLIRVTAAPFLIGAVYAGVILLWPTPEYTGPGPAVPGVSQRHIDVNGTTLHIAESGQAGQPLIVFLHGFPEFWYEWRDYLPYFAERGYHAVAPDQRGYNLSAKPAALENYNVDVLADDIVALIHALGHERAYIVGHDWGAMVAWTLAMQHPETIHKIVILNVPHPGVMKQNVSSNPRQLLRSSYVFALQIPLLAEKQFAFRNWALLTRVMRDGALPGTYPEDILDHYRNAWSRPGAIRAMINWYRAAFRESGVSGAAAKIETPLLMIWGAQDPALGLELAQPSIEMCQQGRLVLVEDATHWIVHERTEKVRVLIEDFFGEEP